MFLPGASHGQKSLAGPPHPIPLDHPSAPALSALFHAPQGASAPPTRAAPQRRAPPRLAHGDLASLVPHERLLRSSHCRAEETSPRRVSGT